MNKIGCLRLRKLALAILLITGFVFFSCGGSGGEGTNPKSVVGKITYYDTAFDVDTSDFVGRSPQLTIGTGSTDIQDWTFEAENLPEGVTIDNDSGVIQYSHTTGSGDTVEQKSYKIVVTNTNDNYEGTIETSISILIGNLIVVSGKGALGYDQPSPFTSGQDKDSPIDPGWDFSLISPEKDPPWAAEDFNYSLGFTSQGSFPEGITISDMGVVSLTKSTPPGRYDFLIQAVPKDLSYTGSYLAELTILVNSGNQEAVRGTITYHSVNFDISTSNTIGIQPQFDIITGSGQAKDWAFSGVDLPAGVSVDPNNGAVLFDGTADNVAVRSAGNYAITAVSSHYLYEGTLSAYISITISDDPDAVVSNNGGFLYSSSGFFPYGSSASLSPTLSQSEITPSKTPAWTLDDFKYNLTIEGLATNADDPQIRVSNASGSEGKITTTAETPKGSYSLIIMGIPSDLTYSGSIISTVVITVGAPGAEALAGTFNYDSPTAEFGLSGAWDPILNIHNGKSTPWQASDLHYSVTGIPGISISNNTGTQGRLAVDGTQTVGTHSVVIKARPVDALSDEYVGSIEETIVIDITKAVLSGEALSYVTIVTGYGQTVTNPLEFHPGNINREKDPVWVPSDFIYSLSSVPVQNSLSINSTSGQIKVGNATPAGSYTLSITGRPSSSIDDDYTGSITGTASVTVNIVNIGEVANISMEYPDGEGFYEKLFSSAVTFQNSPIPAAQYRYDIRSSNGSLNGITVDDNGIVSTSMATTPHSHEDDTPGEENPAKVYAIVITATPKDANLYTGSLSASFNLTVHRRRITANLNTGTKVNRDASVGNDGYEGGIIKFFRNGSSTYSSHIVHTDGTSANYREYWGEFSSFDDATLEGRYSGGTANQEAAAAARWTWGIDLSQTYDDDAVRNNVSIPEPGRLRVSNSFISGTTRRKVTVVATPLNVYYEPVYIRVFINR